MASPEMSSVVTNNHLMVFGGIIHGFARIEGAMIATLAALSNVEFVLLVILMRGLGYEQKRDALYSYFVQYETTEALQVPIRNFLDEVHEYAPLRNHIAHSYWIAGKRPGSIKPVTMKVRGGKGKMVGISDDEPDYLELELRRFGDKIRMVHNSLLTFLSNQGLLSDIDKNTLDTISDASLSEGVEAK